MLSRHQLRVCLMALISATNFTFTNKGINPTQNKRTSLRSRKEHQGALEDKQEQEKTHFVFVPLDSHTLWEHQGHIMGKNNGCQENTDTRVRESFTCKTC